MTDPVYWKGYNAKADTALVHKLFHGRVIRDQKTGRVKLKNLERNSSDESQAIDALRRLLLHILKRSLSHWPHDDIIWAVLPALADALDPEADTARRLEFKFRKGNRSDFASDLQVALHVTNLCVEGWPKEAAVESARTTFQLTRENVYAAVRRSKRHLGKLGISEPFSIE